MSSKRRQRRQQCDGKDRLTQTEAIARKHSIRKRTGDRLNAYPCAYCGHWHVGHPPARIRQSIAAQARSHRENQ